MIYRISKFLITILFLKVITAGTLSSQTIIVHDIVVAANPLAAYSNSKIDTILSRINKILEKSDYAWDTACTGIRFRRNGEVIKHASIPASGSDDALFNAKNLFAPSANIILALDVTTCGGVNAVDGCGFVGRESFAIQPSIDDPSVWLHERGHNVGLDHAQGELQDESAVPQEWGKRVMFWRVGNGHTGLTASECAAFKVKKFASIKEVAAVMAAETSSDPEQEALEKALSVLTLGARDALNPSPHALDLGRLVSKLNDADLDSLSEMLNSGIPNAGWPRAVDILAFAGRTKDEAVLLKALSMPSPAAAGPLTDAVQDQLVTLRQIKLASIKAIPVFCLRAKSAACETNALATLASPAFLATVEPALQPQALQNAAEALSAIRSPAAQDKLNDILRQTPSIDQSIIGKNADRLRSKFQIQ